MSLLSPTYIITICILTASGRIVYITKRERKTDFNLELSDFKYKIRKEALYKRDRWIYREALNRLGRIHEYWILFLEGKEDPLFPTNPAVTPYELYLVNNSTAMSKLVMDYIKSSGFNPRMIFLVIIFALVLGWILVNFGGLTI